MYVIEVISWYWLLKNYPPTSGRRKSVQMSEGTVIMLEILPALSAVHLDTKITDRDSVKELKMAYLKMTSFLQSVYPCP